uniref:Alzheimer's disease amyloid A4 protein-like protein n=1 Tax=Oikopleura dioica TaxID=34765 RepID=Q675U5_OIKDI|nr:Alzheimer's disease amyloid A4 protein-like protein [Oikopleura dioica]
MVMVYECLHRDNNPNVRKEIKHIDEFVIPRIIVLFYDFHRANISALAVPPMCAFRHTPKVINGNNCKDVTSWRTVAQDVCGENDFELHSFAPLATCADHDVYQGLQFVCCPPKVYDLPVAMAIKSSPRDVEVSRIELNGTPSVAAAAVAVGAACVLLLTALAAITVRGRQRVRRERRLANQRTPLSPEERHLQVCLQKQLNAKFMISFSGSRALAMKIRLIDSLKLGSETLHSNFSFS